VVGVVSVRLRSGPGIATRPRPRDYQQTGLRCVFAVRSHRLAQAIPDSVIGALAAVATARQRAGVRAIRD
jgi:hypothetical protein